MSGTLKVRSNSGRARHRAMTPKFTIAKAANVPIEVASANWPKGTNAARIEMMTVTMIVLFTGVWVLGFTLVNTFGSIPSRPMANRMRVWPYMTTRTTEKIEITAPRAIRVGAHWLPVTSAAMLARTASAPAPSNSSQGRAPIAAAVTRMYRIVTMISDKMMARGRSFLAFLASSPAVEAASNPM